MKSNIIILLLPLEGNVYFKFLHVLGSVHNVEVYLIERIMLEVSKDKN